MKYINTLYDQFEINYLASYITNVNSYITTNPANVKTNIVEFEQKPDVLKLTYNPDSIHMSNTDSKNINNNNSNLFRSLTWKSIILLTITTPVIGAIFIGLNSVYKKSNSQEREREKYLSNLKKQAIVFSIVTLIETSYFINKFVNKSESLESEIIDGLNISFVILTSILTPVALLASWRNVKENKELYLIVQLIIESILLAVFLVSDILTFYIAFESVLIPLFLIVGIWGGNARSAFLLFLYTLGGSLFILLSIVLISSSNKTTDFMTLTVIKYIPLTQIILWAGFAIALSVKTPIVPFHIWLPRAHADAPLAGSIILAGTVLKLATYGFIRIILPVLPDAVNLFTPTLQCVAIISLIYSSFTTIRQTDFKALVAYSSVAHIAVVVLGIFSNNIIGILGAIILSLAHGFVSPALFIIVGGVLYDRVHDRTIIYYRGLVSYIPLASILFFILTLCNIGTPLSINWIGEFIALAGTFQRSPFIGAIACIGIVLSACYSIWLWARIVTGHYSPYLPYLNEINRREYAVLFPLIILTILFGIFPIILIKIFLFSTSNLLIIIN